MMSSSTTPRSLAAYPGDDFLFGDDGDDIIGPAGSCATGGGNDFLSGGQGNDVLDGGPGSDTADYSEKLDTVVVALNGPNDTQVLVGGFAEDTIRNIENINGGAGDDKIKGDGLDQPPPRQWRRRHARRQGR